MAGNRIKGITIEIGGDTTKLTDSLKGIDKSLKNTQSQLKDVDKLLKLDPKNTDLLKQKNQIHPDMRICFCRGVSRFCNLKKFLYQIAEPVCLLPYDRQIFCLIRL